MVCGVVGLARAIRTTFSEADLIKQLGALETTPPTVDTPGIAECGEALRPVVQTVTYRDVFSPVLDDTYTFRNHRSGQLLASNAIGSVTVWDDLKSKMSQWKLRKIKNVAGFPRYTLKNRGSGRYLSVLNGNSATVKECGGERLECQWNLVLANNGSLWGLKNFGVESMDENAVSFLSNPRIGTAVGGPKPVVMGEPEDDDSLWMMNAASQPLFPRRRSKAITAQFAVSQTIPLWPFTTVTWGDTCGDQRQTDCSDIQEVFTRERTFHIARGKLDEEYRTRYITENQMQKGMCDILPSGLQKMFRNPAWLAEVINSPYAGAQQCSGYGPWDFVASLEAAAIAECFSECLGVLKQHASQVSCELPADFKKGERMITGEHFSAIVNESAQCAGLPWTSLEQLMGWTMGQQCTHFRRPSPLWVTNDKSMYNIDQVCAVKEGSTRKSDIYESNGTCPEGTHCDCPRSYIVSRQTPVDIRKDGGNLFIVDGSAGIPSYLAQQATRLLTRVAIYSLIMPGAGLTAIGLRVVTSPSTWFRWVGSAFTSVKNIVTWKCQNSAGCWLDQPKKGQTPGSKHGCRHNHADGALRSGSDVWFLPPPYLKLTKSWFFCKVDVCSMREKVTQQVGFGDPSEENTRAEVKNCQPLSFEEMDLTQKKEFVTKLEVSGMNEEYSSEFETLKTKLGMP